MDRPVQATFASDPEVQVFVRSKTCGRDAVPVLLDFHDERVAERRQGVYVEAFSALVIGYRYADVIDRHCLPRESWAN
jgi:hypothetical protein